MSFGRGGAAVLKEKSVSSVKKFLTWSNGVAAGTPVHILLFISLFSHFSKKERSSFVETGIFIICPCRYKNEIWKDILNNSNKSVAIYDDMDSMCYIVDIASYRPPHPPPTYFKSTFQSSTTTPVQSTSPSYLVYKCGQVSFLFCCSTCQSCSSHCSGQSTTGAKGGAPIFGYNNDDICTLFDLNIGHLYHVSNIHFQIIVNYGGENGWVYINVCKSNRATGKWTIRISKFK